MDVTVVQKYVKSGEMIFLGDLPLIVEKNLVLLIFKYLFKMPSNNYLFVSVESCPFRKLIGRSVI